ncbi:MAG: VWA domain-containing protein [Polyangiales bacterium]
MRLFGLDAWSLALALALVGALLVALYLRKRPARRQHVPSLALWSSVVAGGTRARRSLPLSLLLALLIASLLLGALSDPRPAYQASEFTLLIERGVAMSARDVGGTRLEAAKRAAHARVDALRPGDRAQVISYAAHASTHSALTEDHAALHAAIDHIAQSDARSDPQAPFPRRAHVVSFGGTNVRADERVPIGSSQRNVGIRRFSARSYPLDRAHGSCLITVANFGPREERVTLRVRAEALLHQETFVLPAQGELTRTLDDVAGTELEASITLADGPDPLAADDRALAVLPRRAPRVLLVSPGDRYLEAALRIDPQLQVAKEGAHELVIFDRTLPDRAPDVPALYLGPPAQGGQFPLARGTHVQRPYFERLQSTPLLTGLGLRDVNITRALSTVLEVEDHALAASADGTPLLVEGRRQAPFLALTFALGESDLGLRAAFPVLLLRMIDQLLGEPVAAETQVAGQPLPYPASLRAPDGTLTPLVAFERAGRHELVVGEQNVPIAVLAHAGSIAPQGRATPPPARTSWYWPALAGLAAILLVLEQVGFRRGWLR